MLDSVVSQLKKIEELKSEVFYTHLSTPGDGLSLSVEPVGSVIFPISAKVAKSLIVEAEPARYGLKDKTLFDRKIRDTWEIPNSRIQTTKDWDSQLSKVLQKIQRNLNLPEDGVLRSELHNMLIYMPGQFFKAHQDSEKDEGMVATLMVLLPSEFTGGEFVIDQHGDRRILDFSNEARKDLIFTAFYSDCYHEVKEVKSGYRVTITYNLFFQSSAKSLVTRRNPGLEITVQDYFSMSQENGDGNFSRPQWLVYLLDHEYTRSSLDWLHLRGLDRDRVGEFLACSDHLGLTAHLALADVHETWSTESDNDWGRRHRRRWNNDEELDEVGPGDYRLTELIEDEILLRHWIARTGKKFEEWDKYIPKPMVCWTKAVDQFKPFKSDYEGYMGNYGDTLDRWYHRAAIILWKKEDDLVSLFSCDKAEALRSISEILKKDLNQGHQALHQVLPYWPEKMHPFLDPKIVLEFANLLQDQELASNVTKTLGISSLREKNLRILMRLVESYGEEWFISILNSWRETRDWNDQDSISNELESLVREFSQTYKKISHWILQDQLSLLVKSDAIEVKHLDLREVRKKFPQKLKIIESLLKVSHSVGIFELHKQLVEHVLKRSTLYPEVEVVNLFLNLDQQVYRQALIQLGKNLQKQNSGPRKEGDWCIRDAVPHNCPDCQYLENFLLSTSTQKLVWPLAKDRRAHIHQIINAMDIPVTHETLHQGSPHKLVLIKTSELFKRDRERALLINTSLKNLREHKIMGVSGD